MGNIEKSGIGNWINNKEYDGTCVQCKNYHDYGPVAAHYCSVDGKCEIDGHEISGALCKCTIDKFDSRLIWQR